MCTVPSVTVFCSSLTSFFPDMLFRYFLHDLEFQSILLLLVFSAIYVSVLCKFYSSNTVEIFNFGTKSAIILTLCCLLRWAVGVYVSFHVVLLYTGCPRRNVRHFGRVFLMLNYTDITQNIYIQS